MRLSKARLQLVDTSKGAESLVCVNKGATVKGLDDQGTEEAYDNNGPEEPKTDIAFVALLKQCATQKDLDKGSRLHDLILKRGLLRNNMFIGNTLISMYAKCGALAMAHQAFDELPVQDVVSWNALIAGYSQHGQGEKAIICFFQMQQEGYPPNAMTFTCILKACGSIGAFKQGKEVHSCILRDCDSRRTSDKETQSSVRIGSVLGGALLDMYAKCGVLTKAQEVFDELEVTDVVSWTALIKGYCESGQSERALKNFELMKSDGLVPDTVAFACILKACVSRGAANEGERLHAEIVRVGLLGKDVVLEGALLDMYAKCGALWKAQQMFNELPARDLVAWNSLIAGYSQHAHGDEALKCFTCMQCKGPSPDPVTFACILKACGSIGVGDMGQDVHAEIVRKGLLGNNISLGNALVDMYAKCGELAKAQEVFDELLVRDVVSWNTLVAGYAQHGRGGKALECYASMRQGGLSPSPVTFACILKSCGSIKALGKGKELHAEIVRDGVLASGSVVGNALVDMYSKCGEFGKAQQIFNDLPHQDVVSWNVLISGFCEQGNSKDALRCLERMTHEGLSPHEATFICILKACSNSEVVEKGRAIHGEIARMGWLGKSTVLGSALVDMYAKCGVLAEAQELFDELDAQDVVSWNALITGYCDHGNCEEAIICFERAKLKGLFPDLVTFVCILKACSNIGAVEKGTEIHTEIMRKGLLGTDCVLGNAVVDMYAKCGSLAKAQQVFDELPFRDVVSWNILIMGYCRNGLGKEALNCFHHMEHEGLSPDAATFVSVLKACGSTGVPEKGQPYFEIMTTMYGIIPTIEHCTCMVYLDGLAGNFEKAMADIENWPFSDSFPAWVALLGACQQQGNVNLGRLAFKLAVQLDKNFGFAYTCMNSIYGAVHIQGDVDEHEFDRTIFCQEVSGLHHQSSMPAT